MEPNKTALERAFELAKSGRFPTTHAVKMAVSSEGYQVSQITGPTLLRQLRQIIQANHTSA